MQKRTDQGPIGWLKKLHRLRPRLMTLCLSCLILCCLSGLTTLVGGIYIDNSLGIRGQTEPVAELGHYYAVGTNYRAEITKQQYDTWRLENHWAIAMFFLGAITAFTAISIFLYVSILYLRQTQ